MAKTTRASIYMTEGDIQRIYTNRTRVSRERNPVPQMLASAKSRAKKFKLDFGLTLADVIVPKVCPVLNIPLDFSTKDNTPSLDRVIPSLGYVIGNVRVISWRANRIKLNATAEELWKIAAYVQAATEKVLDKHGEEAS